MFLRNVRAPLSATPESTSKRRENLRSPDIQFFLQNFEIKSNFDNQRNVHRVIFL
jgi:hypothetical protein